MPDSHAGPGTGTPTLITPGAMGRMIAPVRGRIALGALMSAASSILAIVPFVAVAQVVELLLRAEAPAGRVWAWVIGGLLAMVGRSLLYGGSLMICHAADVDFVHLLRRQIVAHLTTLPLGWFGQEGSGEIKKAVTDDVTRIHVIVAHLAGDLTSAVLVPVVSLIYLLSCSPPMTGLLLAYVVVVFAASTPAMSRGFTQHMDEWNRAQGRLSSATVELVDGIEVVKTYGEGSATFRRFSSAVDRLTAVAYSWTAAMGRPAAFLNIMFFPGSMVAVILALGLLGISGGWFAPAGLVPFLLVGVGLPAGYLQIAQMANGLRSAALGATHIDRLLHARSLPPPTAPEVPTDSTVVLDHVDFAYTDGNPVLHDVDLTLAPGTVTALVGPSGSGKTTVSRLIPRFWDVTGGAVRVGGIDIRQIPTAELLSRISIVFQETVLVTGTVRENIRLGRPQATDAQVEQAARDAQIHDRICALPQGYDTVIGSAQGHLSGGELQRLTIARAIVQDAPIVLLDEATAHADPHSEVEIQRALTRLGQGRTLLVIAHRLSTVVHADQIIVLDDGRIAERGTHQQLLAADGLYARLWQAQNAATERAGSSHTEFTQAGTQR